MIIRKAPPFPIKEGKVLQPNADPEKNRNRFGRMVYFHKTGAVVDVMTREQFNNFKSYEPGRMGMSSIKTRSKSNSGQAETI